MLQFNGNFENIGTEVISIPAEGAYRFTTERVEMNANARVPQVRFVLRLETGHEHWVFENLPPEDPKAKGYRPRMSTWKRCFLAHGMAPAALQGQVNFDLEQLIAKSGVVYVENHEEEVTDPNTGVVQIKTRTPTTWVLPEDQQAALAGEWTPSGGRKSSGQGMVGQQTQQATQAQQQAAFNPNPPQQQPQQPQQGNTGGPPVQGQQQNDYSSMFGPQP